LNIADWIQSLSLLLVAGALIASIFQTRAVARQARQATIALQATTHQSFVHNQNASRQAFFLDHPDLLSWHLSSRGYRSTNAEENQRRLYVLIKLDIHEYNYLSFRAGHFRDDIWSGWMNVMHEDFSRVPEFREIWSVARKLYAPSFVNFIEENYDTLVPDDRAPR
jgi:hypothetical protein